MTELAKALERFNRKERNLLVRSVLGHAERPLQLSAPFRHDLASVLNIPTLSETAWWATDYHMSWMADALAVYLNDKCPLAKARPNPECNGRRLVEGNQEDIDLLIAVGQHLIMVEAKAYGAWSNRQVKSKLQRLDLLLAYYDQIKRPEHAVDFHLVLMSPQRPQKLTKPLPKRLNQLWPEPELPWLQLKLETSVCKVTRCQLNGTPAADGDYWRVLNRNASSEGQRNDRKS